MKRILLFVLFIATIGHVFAQQSVARKWSDVMLNCIRKDFARPTVQARTIAHASWAMYDAFAIYDGSMEPYLIGHTVGPYTSYFSGVAVPDDVTAAQEEAISFAMYRWLTYRFQTTTPTNSWNNFMSGYINTLMTQLGYDASITSTDYTDGDPAKLGNFIAQELINYGLLDGTNKANNHANQYYFPVNGDIYAVQPGNPQCVDPNRWQRMYLDTAFDQSGNPIGSVPPALTPEWGDAVPFSLTEDQSVVYNRDGHDWKVYLDPGAPPYIDTTQQQGLESIYKWGFFTNILWHSYHDTEDGVLMDISPNNIGNLQTLPDSFDEYPAFYDIYNGGPNDPGYNVNPATGLPYAPQIVKRGDYTRVLSEYWADGPASETPPGHWVKIFNEVADHPLLEKKWMGQGATLSNLEWDVRGYFAVCSGLYDAAIACWSTKGYYDYTRPIMAIRYMCDKGQSSDPLLPSYHPAGIPLVPGIVELVYAGDPLAGANNENVGKIKLYTWQGPPSDPLTQVSGVGWILGEMWYTFQKKTFVTPPFAGYFSGHSTYSRTAAEIMTLVTGDEYFPGGMSEFTATAGQYLLAEDGPTENIVLQWAKYKDASDQCSLSRIYGGLHPPQDDIPGRQVGMIVGPQAFNKANDLINASLPFLTGVTVSDANITNGDVNSSLVVTIDFSEAMNTTFSPSIGQAGDDAFMNSLTETNAAWIDGDTYQVTYTIQDGNENLDHVVFSVAGAQDPDGNAQNPGLSEVIAINTVNAQGTLAISDDLINDADLGTNQLVVNINYDVMMDVSVNPTISFGEGNSSLVFNSGYWNTDMNYIANFDVVDQNIELSDLTVEAEGAMDTNGVEQDPTSVLNAIDIDTQAPTVAADFSAVMINDLQAGSSLVVSAMYDEQMNTAIAPSLTFPIENPADAGLIWNEAASMWIDDMTFSFVFDIIDLNVEVAEIDFLIAGAQDANGNGQDAAGYGDAVSVDTQNPAGIVLESSDDLLSDLDLAPFTIGVTVTYDALMDTTIAPVISFNEDETAAGLEYLSSDSEWLDESTFLAIYELNDANVDIQDWVAFANGGVDSNGNPQDEAFESAILFDIDTENPSVVSVSANDVELTQENQLLDGFQLVINFDQAMDQSVDPVISFPNEDPTATLSASPTSDWLNPYAFQANYNMDVDVVNIEDIDVLVEGATDLAGNELVAFTITDFFDINTTISVSELGQLESFNIYPNPAQGGTMITIAWSSTENAHLAIYNTIGELVFNEQNIAAGDQNRRIDTSEFASGMYLVQVYDGLNWINQPIQIVR
jgi:hypothetical protein